MRRTAFAAALLLAAPAVAQQAPPSYPQLSAEADIGLYSVSTVAAPDAVREGTSVYLFGELAAGLHLAPNFSLQGVLAFEPIGEGDSTGGTPDRGVIFFRRQAAYLEALFAEWKPADALTLYGGRFVAPFGRGYHDFPGILTRLRAHEVEMVGDSLGAGGSWTFLSDPTFGEHDLSAAVFTLDRTFLSSTWITRRRCCDERYERFNRNTEQQGGPGNTGRLDNFAVALDGDGFSWLPGFSYHLAVVSRGHGVDGTAREWGYAGAIRYEHRWSRDQATLLFAEAVQFRSAGGRPFTEVSTTTFEPGTGEEVEGTAETTLAERRTFTTLGVQHRHGPWRGTLAWQRDQRKRSVDTMPTENYVEASVGRDIGGGFGLDVGYQYGRYVREETATLGTSHAILVRLGYQGGF
ncbi:hypothetical protein GXW74_02850 [Roseomonas eburnea]|uniref:Outer membrane beta-barrel protein n=1 Tax=Neoroseomonas eburnea TaxID=1346889 RepID=A0A9X9X6S7_9PROT|nr:hypothetical protein [Neoroseomonas eburnea]MBR0679413.1 hypothetical protein [Neoroseomonas eburnea]